MLYLIIVINVLLGAAVMSAYYPAAGIAYVAFCGLMLTVGYNTALGSFLIRTQMKKWGNRVDEIVYSEKRLLTSIACLTLSLKLGAAVALLVETGAALMIAFCILMAFGYFFEGAASGMTVGLSWGIARFAVKIFTWLSIGFDKIAEWIAKAELSILKIDY